MITEERFKVMVEEFLQDVNREVLAETTRLFNSGAVNKEESREYLVARCCTIVAIREWADDITINTPEAKRIMANLSKF